ncbi:hypothetical protein acsn021_42810 [Anaerocolumna cellulosilytica]|uniref:Uncharacterized protein n=1 Tax=Anaerocolumna cellulosilytica TaxID=433286 RepID=A0A6S6RBX0_9FIRM|nr:hypothetical protein [Anaerocolumna cellulosilytica]MBB5195239.1 hypothetical protein [Anaerocolumna cellulosilytica]BCJ96712.1 hypothetical protein acsn021_42810 [Anaerocolumna cellulosilytica]
MMKYVYRTLILLCIFAGSLYYFGKDIQEEVSDIEIRTVEMGETTFPLITIRLKDYEINQLHGYSTNLNANIVRENITPLDSSQSFDVVINEKGNNVKRVIYELRALADNKLIETNTINALEKEEEYKTARIKLSEALSPDTEYAVKITLVTSESQKMNYYTRIKRVDNSYYKEKLNFIMNFHTSILDKKKAEEIKTFLEPKAGSDNTSLAYVDIHSSFDLVSWGNLEPKVVGPIVPDVEEINTDTASVVLRYMVSGETESGTEYYYVSEFYRVRYTDTRMYLLNYDRKIESVFDINLTSLAKSQFKIGITNQSDMKLFTSTENNKLSFVRERELWYYNLLENKAVRVFSFRQENTDYVRDIYPEHDVQILNMDDDGNIDFMVYGYMNRGVYEGRVGIVFYKYYSSDNRIEELVYLPMNIPYEVLKEELDSFSYKNKLNVFYFTINHKIYSYNLTTKAAEVIASDITGDNFVVSMKEHFLAWENSSNQAEATEINILDLETQSMEKITALTGECINLLGKIDDNIIYGFAKVSDVTTALDGSQLIPMYKIEIADKNNTVLKEYRKNKYYVTDTMIADNVITLKRVKKAGSDFTQAEEDFILNRVITSTSPFSLTTRVTDKMLTEYYITLPSGFEMSKVPATETTVNTVIKEDTTLRLEESKRQTEPYTVYARGGIEGIYEEAGEAIVRAYNRIGIVVDNKQRIIWERAVRSTLKEIRGITPIYTSHGSDSVTASVTMLLQYRSGSSETKVKKGTVYEMLREGLKDSVLNLTGCTLEQVLYYVNKNHPVIAMKNGKDAVLIIGYDAYNITVIDPSINRTMKIGLKDGTSLFEGAGNIFFSYMQ